MEQIIAGMTKLFGKFHELFAYVAVGVMNTIVGYGIYAFCIFIGLHFVIATLVAQILGAGFNYLTYGKLVFKNQPRLVTLIKFAIVYAVLYVAAIAIVWSFKKVGLNDYLAGVVSIALMPILSFLLNKFFVFTSKQNQEKQ